MMNNNHKKSGCGFDELLVSYIYGEAEAGEASKFEAHLADCAVCADELAAFSGLQFAINDWKSKEFAALETPVIEIPYPIGAQTNKIMPAKVSWRVGLRKFWSHSPAWSLAAASAFILSIAVGLILFALNSRNGSDVAEGVDPQNPVMIAPTLEKLPEPKIVDSRNLPVVNNPERRDLQTTPELTSSPGTKNRRVDKQPNNPRPAQKAEITSSAKNDELKHKNKNKTAPPVLPDEEEDDTLRLAELFEEIDTKE